MKFCSGDVEINYEIIGEGLPIVMLNGYFNDSIAWKSCMEPILSCRSDYKRIYFDYPGTGKSNISDSIKTWDDLFNLILLFIDSIIPNEKFLLVGHSFGGFLARGVLKRRFDRVEGIMLACPVGRPRFEDRNIDKKISSILNISPEREKLIKSRLNREVVKSQKNTNKDYLKELRKNSVERHYDFDHLDKPFVKPALIMAGKQDKSVGYKNLYEVYDNFHRASLVILDNGKHDIQIEQDGIFTVLVNEWLMRIEEYNTKYGGA